MSQPTRPPTDGECIAAVLAGNLERFSVLVERYELPLLHAARSRLGSRELAEDAVQETFLCVFRSLASYNSQYSFRTWLWTILLNQCRARYRQQQRHPTTVGSTSEQLQQQASVEISPPERLLKKEQAERLAALLQQLPEPQADCLRLRFFGGLKFQEIADCVGCSLSVAKNRVRLGLEKMSTLVRREEAHVPLLPAVPSAIAPHNNSITPPRSRSERKEQY